MASAPFLSHLVHAPPVQDHGVDLIDAVRSAEPWARTAFYDQHAPEVARVLASVLGPDNEIADLVQETFVEAFQAIGRLRDRSAVSAWIRQIAVNRARSCIRRRRRQRWFAVLGFSSAPEPEAPIATPEQREALAETYRILGELSDDLRVAFALRHIEGFELTDVAAACSVSLATIKRRLATAEARFDLLARRGGKLDDWLSPEQPQRRMDA